MPTILLGACGPSTIPDDTGIDIDYTVECIVGGSIPIFLECYIHAYHSLTLLCTVNHATCNGTIVKDSRCETDAELRKEIFFRLGGGSVFHAYMLPRIVNVQGILEPT